jgi:hypothetical protein
MLLYSPDGNARNHAIAELLIDEAATASPIE